MPGGRTRYQICSSVHGILDGFTVGATSWRHKARDLQVGWSQAARDSNIGLVINKDRFLLLLPGVRGQASLARSLLVDRVADDWEGAQRCPPSVGVQLRGSEARRVQPPRGGLDVLHVTGIRQAACRQCRRRVQRGLTRAGCLSPRRRRPRRRDGSCRGMR